MIGNLTDAALAATFPGTYFLGEGAFRSAYLINGVVYKVVWDGDGIGDNANLCEWEAYHELGAFPIGINVPDTNLWAVGGMPVIAMEYIDGMSMGECYCAPEETHHACLPAEVYDELCRAGFYDLGYGNVIYDGTYWVVDFQ